MFEIDISATTGRGLDGGTATPNIGGSPFAGGVSATFTGPSGWPGATTSSTNSTANCSASAAQPVATSETSTPHLSQRKTSNFFPSRPTSSVSTPIASEDSFLGGFGSPNDLFFTGRPSTTPARHNSSPLMGSAGSTANVGRGASSTSGASATKPMHSNSGSTSAPATANTASSVRRLGSLSIPNGSAFSGANLFASQIDAWDLASSLNSFNFNSKNPIPLNVMASTATKNMLLPSQLPMQGFPASPASQAQTPLHTPLPFTSSSSSSSSSYSNVFASPPASAAHLPISHDSPQNGATTPTTISSIWNDRTPILSTLDEYMHHMEEDEFFSQAMIEETKPKRENIYSKRVNNPSFVPALPDKLERQEVQEKYEKQMRQDTLERWKERTERKSKEKGKILEKQKDKVEKLKQDKLERQEKSEKFERLDTHLKRDKLDKDTQEKALEPEKNERADRAQQDAMDTSHPSKRSRNQEIDFCNALPSRLIYSDRYKHLQLKDNATYRDTTGDTLEHPIKVVLPGSSCAAKSAFGTFSESILSTDFKSKYSEDYCSTFYKRNDHGYMFIKEPTNSLKVNSKGAKSWVQLNIKFPVPAEEKGALSRANYARARTPIILVKKLKVDIKQLPVWKPINLNSTTGQHYGVSIARKKPVKVGRNGRNAQGGSTESTGVISKDSLSSSPFRKNKNLNLSRRFSRKIE